MKVGDAVELSGNPEKVTTSGCKCIYRIINTDNGHAEGDYIALDYENPREGRRLKVFHLVHTYISKFNELHQDIEKEPTLQEI